MALTPAGELTSLGIARETTFGTAVAPTVWLICSDASHLGSNEYLQRDGARKRIGRTKPATGMFMGKGSYSHEADPDTLGALLNMALGAEAVVSDPANPSALAVTSTSQNATIVGFQFMGASPMTNVVVGQSLTVDTTGQQETVVVKQVNTTGFWAYFTKTHANGVTITNAAVVTAYDHTFTLASPRGFYTAQANRVTDAVNYPGCKISSIGFSVNSKSALEAKIATEYQTEAKVGSPATPTYSTLFPFKFENSGNFGKINGAQSTAIIQSWSVDVKTGLVADYPSFGGGRLRGQYPEQQTVVSGQVVLGFDTEDMVQNFWGYSGATGPQNLVLPTYLDFKFISDDYINTALPYSLEIIIATAQLTAVDIPIKANGYLLQTAKFDAYESINGALDDIKCVLVNTASGQSI